MLSEHLGITRRPPRERKARKTCTTGLRPVNSRSPGPRPFCPTTPRRRARPDAAAPISGAGLRDGGPRFAATKKPPKSAATAARERTPSPSRRRRPTSAPVKRNDAAASERRGHGQRQVKVKTIGPRSAAQRPESGQGPGAPDVCARREDEAAPPRARGRRRGRAWDATPVLLLRARAGSGHGRPQHWVVYIVRDAREGVGQSGRRGARYAGAGTRRARATASGRPVSVRRVRRRGLRRRAVPGPRAARPAETMATGGARGLDVYAVKLPAGCVPPCPRCGASANDCPKARRASAPAARSRTAAGSLVETLRARSGPPRCARRL